MSQNDIVTADAGPQGLSGWAIAWLILVILLSGLTLFGNIGLMGAKPELEAMFRDLGDQAPFNIDRLTPEVIYGLLGAGAITIIGAILLLTKLKIGLWLMVAAALATLGLNIYLEMGPLAWALGLLGPVITYLLVRPRWRVLR